MLLWLAPAGWALMVQLSRRLQAAERREAVSKCCAEDYSGLLSCCRTSRAGGRCRTHAAAR